MIDYFWHWSIYQIDCSDWTNWNPIILQWYTNPSQFILATILLVSLNIIWSLLSSVKFYSPLLVCSLPVHLHTHHRLSSTQFISALNIFLIPIVSLCTCLFFMSMKISSPIIINGSLAPGWWIDAMVGLMTFANSLLVLLLECLKFLY